MTALIIGDAQDRAAWTNSVPVDSPRVGQGPPIISGPAARSGLLAGDRIDAVDGTPIRDVADASKRIFGAPGTLVTIAASRDGLPLSVQARRSE